MATASGPVPTRSTLLTEAERSAPIAHGFFSRQGGVSEGIYDSLNVGLGSADDRERVLENRALISRWFALPADRLITVHQVHSPRVHVVTYDNRGERPEADAMVTRDRGLVLGVLSADCGPVLFADAGNGVIGATHAGWRGALDGVLENTVEAMIGLGAERASIVACLGPSISQPNYEVGPEFIDRFLARDADHGQWFSRAERPGHALFDLRGMTLARLQAAGLQAEMIDACTYDGEDAWFSYRRTTHRRETDYGRQISAITLRENDNGTAL
ncbi:hypothetical protein DFR52_106129 [Hoeflea marina]|uniref:Purine nucleoside phosphorylase n=1 Tax=Hoeflea marina TaxID=274592 RepID=A0A317PEQ5_9HYPH|nr:peptidoglycan editing factor PgeF [Hoeflea marina]PWV97606.1 hypothetical protein DFR52_106129 [Hoeflea marina]